MVQKNYLVLTNIIKTNRVLMKKPWILFLFIFLSIACKNSSYEVFRRLAMQSPSVVAEYGGLSRINELLNDFKGERILLVTGRKSFAACGAEGLLNQKLAHYDVARFSDFDTNPKIFNS